MSSSNRPPAPFKSSLSLPEDTGLEAHASITPWIEPDRVPTWLLPFTLDKNTRFTRTPDALLRPLGKGGETPAPVASPAAPASEDAISAPPAPFDGPDPEDEDILIDWTGESLAARYAAEDAEAAEAAEPEDIQPEDAPEAEETTVLAEPVEMQAEAIEAPEPQPPAAEEPSEIAPVAIPAPDLPDGIRRLARLIAIAPAEMPMPAPDQDLVAPVIEEPLAPEPEETSDALPETIPEPVAAAPETPEAPQAEDTHAEAAAFTPAVLQPFGMRVVVQASLAWPLTPSAAPTPSAAEPEALPAPAQEPAPAPSPAPAAAPARIEHPVLFDYELPSLTLLTEPLTLEPDLALSEEALDRNSAALQQTLRDFGVRGEVIDANPGPVVTLYEFEPAPGTKSSRVIGLSPDIARSMSSVSARVAVVEGRNVIGIELPNQRRETVWLRELLSSNAFAEARSKLGLCLGKTIGGEPVIADLARMPHLLVAGTTGSGKSVAINTMILSLLYRLTPEQCRLIMIDPKMLELSVYEGIPHLLTPVVTDPKKAIIALQWAVREMEDRYRKMSRLKVRNIEGFNARVAEAREKGEVITFTVEKGFDRETGEVEFEEVTLDLSPLPYIVIIVDEMADLMMVAGKDIEGAIQRLAQMARAAGIHLVMATQRPSVDVITGTIKANFPTRISFQVTSKIDSRTILGEMGAETLLGQGDMLYMANGGRITRVHGPFVSDGEVEKVVTHLKAQGRPEYLDAVTADEADEEDVEDSAVFDKGALAAEDGVDHYEQAVAIVQRDRKASTSYIQRRLQIGYNKAASLMERMEAEGIVGPANHAGKREILAGRPG